VHNFDALVGILLSDVPEKMAGELCVPTAYSGQNQSASALFLTVLSDIHGISDQCSITESCQYWPEQVYPGSHVALAEHFKHGSNLQDLAANGMSKLPTGTSCVLYLKPTLITGCW
jgi:hypothetical protein